MPYEVTVRELPAQPVAATRTSTDLRRISAAIGTGVHAIMDELGRRGIEPAGPLQVVYHADQVLDDDTAAPIEICFPVAAPFQWSGEVYGTELAGGPREVYLNDPGQVPEPDLLTEVQWPIR